jgi:S-methylmethionine-dependent homocysteine/selenocysteine methylase
VLVVLPSLDSDRLFVADGGLETTMIFDHGIELPCFASRRSHAELDEAAELDRGDPRELGALYKELKPHLSAVRVLGGCCGTGTPHIASICDHWLAGTGSS